MEFADIVSLAHLTARELIGKLGLQPHPEGGWYREIHRSPQRVRTTRGERSALTTIYYLLEHTQLSRWHVVQADESWHFYAGAPLELFEYDTGRRRVTRHVLGSVALDAATPVAVVPAGAWQAARSLGDYTLVGCTVGPGFEFADFQFVSEVPAHTDHFVDGMADLTTLL